MNSVKWRKVDLHIHSDASHDCNVSPEELVEDIIDKRINLFSVTDHNTIDNVNAIKSIVNEKQEDGIDVEFLPGIEVRTDKGGRAVHVVAIFPESITQAILKHKFLPPLELTKTDVINKGKEHNPDLDDAEAYIKGLEIKYVNFEEVVKTTKSLGGMVIAAHPKSRCGVQKELDWKNTQNELIKDLVNSIDALEALRNKAEEDRDFYLNKDGKFIGVKPCLKNSDAHFIGENPRDSDDPRVIGENYTWIKMDTLDFNGLSQILYEPELRICVSEDKPKSNYPYISEIKVDGGYFKNVDSLNFSPELNTIIGGRGCGKSVVVDLIKFAFGKYDIDDEKYMDRLYNLLRPSNNVEVKYVDIDGEENRFTRELKLSKNDDDSFQEEKYDISIPFDIDIFGQGKLKEITKQARRKMKLIDDIGNNDRLINNISETKDKIEDNAEEQIKKLKSIRKDLDEIEKKVSVKKSIVEKSLKIEDPVVRKYKKTEKQKKYFDLLRDNINEIIEKKYAFIQDISNLLNISFPEDVEDQIINKFRKVSETVFSDIYSNEINNHINLIYKLEEIKKIKFDGEEWLELYNKVFEECKEYLRDNDMEDVFDEANQLRKLKNKLAKIENNIEPRVEKVVEELKQMQNQRKELVTDYYALNEELWKNRVEIANELSNNNELLEINLSDEKSYRNIKKKIKQVLTGMHVQESQIDKIVDNNLDGKDLSKLIKENDIQKIIDNCSITPKTAGKIISEFSGEYDLEEYELNPISKDLFDLELLIPEDQVTIKLLNEIKNKYENISKFSPGQQCSALLSILVGASDKPLIIDQPEDELDWQYVDELITKIRGSKCNQDGVSRQFIFVTHNQNITVLADSEKVFKLKHLVTEDKKGKIEATGGVERSEVKKAVLSLEGGEKAFLRRGNKYGFKI